MSDSLCVLIDVHLGVESIVVGGRHFWRFVLAGGPPYILYTYLTYHFMYSMYIYNYIHICWADRNVKNPPANNYGVEPSSARVAGSASFFKWGSFGYLSESTAGN